MVYWTIVPLIKLTCTKYVEFGKHLDTFPQFLWRKIDTNYLNVKLENFNRVDKNDLSTVRNPIMGYLLFAFMQLRSQIVIEEKQWQNQKFVFHTD